MKIILARIGAVILLLLVVTTISSIFRNFTSDEPSNHTEQQFDVSAQQEEFLKLYQVAISGIKVSNSLFYTTHNLLNKASRTSVYDAFKNSEETHSRLSVTFIATSADLKKSYPSLKKYHEDISQSFNELADVSAHRQLEAKYTADFLNTGSLESSRKATLEMDGTGEAMSNAVSRLVFGVGKNIGMDTSPLQQEYEQINIDVKKDFDSRFGKIIH